MSYEIFGSLSRRCHSSDTWTGSPVVGGSTWSSGIWGMTQRMRGLCEEYIAAANGSSLDWGSLNCSSTRWLVLLLYRQRLW